MVSQQLSSGKEKDHFFSICSSLNLVLKLHFSLILFAPQQLSRPPRYSDIQMISAELPIRKKKSISKKLDEREVQIAAKEKNLSFYNYVF